MPKSRVAHPPRKRRGRTYDERLIDRLLLLFTIGDLNMRGIYPGRVKLQKLVFLSEREMLGLRIKGFNYNFIKLDIGPYSDELSRDLELLQERNLIVYDKERSVFILTDKGRDLLMKLSDVIRENKDILSIIRHVNEEHGYKSLDELLDHVYSLKRPLKGKKIPIRDIPPRTPLLKRIREEKAKQTFKIGAEALEILAAEVGVELFRDVLTLSDKIKAAIWRRISKRETHVR